MRVRWCVGLSVSMIVSAAAGDPSRGPVLWEPWTGVAFDGSPIEGEIGRLTVPERHARPEGPTIELAFVRYRTTNPNPGPPLLFLAGGPGGSGVELVSRVATHPQIRLLEHCDVIGIDQRGTGLTRPNLMDACPGAVDLPLDRVVDRDDVIAAMIEAVGTCADYWIGQGVDPGAYNSVESADDLDAVREALELDEIVLYGASYGSHLGLAYLRRHPDHVARALLMHVEGPDDTWKLPGTVQRQLARVHDRVAVDARLARDVPDLLGLLRELLRRLDEQPVTPVLGAGSADAVSVTLGPHDLKVEVARALATSDGIAALPAMLHRFAEGDWTTLAESSVARRRVEASLMAVAMDCASGGSPERLAQLERERNDPANVLSDALLAPLYPSVCAACGSPDVGAAFRAPMMCDVPVLFVSGTLDVRTPPANVEVIRGGFSRHAHVIVEHAGHEGRELMSSEYRELMQAFLRGEPVRSCTIALPRVFFDPVDG